MNILDVYYLMLDIVHTGSPLSTIAEVLVENISLRNERLDALPRTKKDWICRLLYTGRICSNAYPCTYTNLFSKDTWQLKAWMKAKKLTKFVACKLLFPRQFLVNKQYKLV